MLRKMQPRNMSSSFFPSHIFFQSHHVPKWCETEYLSGAVDLVTSYYKDLKLWASHANGLGPGALLRVKTSTSVRQLSARPWQWPRWSGGWWWIVFNVFIVFIFNVFCMGQILNFELFTLHCTWNDKRELYSPTHNILSSTPLLIWAYLHLVIHHSCCLSLPQRPLCCFWLLPSKRAAPAQVLAG